MPEARELVERFARVADRMSEDRPAREWIEVYATVGDTTWSIYEGQSEPHRLARPKRYPWSPTVNAFVCVRFDGDVDGERLESDLPSGWVALNGTPSRKSTEAVFVPEAELTVPQSDGRRKGNAGGVV